MDKIEIVVGRLDVARKRLGKNHADIAEILGLAKSSIGSAFSRKSMKVYKIKLLAQELDINFDWLSTGNGDMFITKNTKDIEDTNLTYQVTKCVSCDSKEDIIESLKALILAKDEIINAKNHIIKGLERELKKS